MQRLYDHVIIDVFSVADRPTLKRLLHLQGKDRPIQVIKTIAFKWDSVAIALDFTWNSIQSLKQENYRSESATMAMLSQWIDGGGSWPVNWETLIWSFKVAGFGTLAQDLKLICS